MAVWIFRGFFIIAGTAAGYSICPAGRDPYAFATGALIASLAMVCVEWFLSRSPISVITSVVFGSIVGIALAVLTRVVVKLALGDIYENPTAQRQFDTALMLCLMIPFIYLGVAFLYQTRDKFRVVIPYVEFRREEKGARPVVLDTSVIVDGRINDVLHTGIIDGPIVVPQFILGELHHIADSDDKLKRERGRLGLRVLGQLREDSKLEVRIERIETDTRQAVDERLIDAAKRMNARIMTNDFNLNRLATVAGVEILNLNELANALKPIALPNESLDVTLIKRGEQPGQAVGYLEDGTMVVVEEATEMLGDEVQIVVTNTITRDTGRMIFGRLPGKKNSNDTTTTRMRRRKG